MHCWRETIQNKTDKILKRLQVDGVCRMDSVSSWPQGEDSNSSSLFGRWLQVAWTGHGEARQPRGMQPVQCELSNGLWSGPLKFHPTGSSGRPAQNILQNYPNWGRENCGIYPQGPTCQCWRVPLPGAVMSSAHLPALQWLRGSRPVGWESPQPWLQLEAVSWHPGHTWAPAPALAPATTLRL